MYNVEIVNQEATLLKIHMHMVEPASRWYICIHVVQ